MLISLEIRMINQLNYLIVLGTLCLSQPKVDSQGRWKTCLVGVGWAKTHKRCAQQGNANC